MGFIAFVAMLMLMYRGKHAPTPVPNPNPLPDVPHPSAPALPQPTPAQAVKNASTPAPWPTARPSGLAPWPGGWTPANPPPPAVVTRAWQLLQPLWAKGVGSTAVEQTGGQWITYVASWMNATKTMKGVVAFKQKPEAIPQQAPPPQPSANA